MLIASRCHCGPEIIVGFFANSIFLILFFVLIVGWVFSFLVYHVAGGLIHILLIVAVISLILHFVRGSRAA